MITVPLSVYVVLLPVWLALISGVAVGAAGAQSAWGGVMLAAVLGCPNRLGVTVCRLLRVDDRTLHVQGLDAIDGTPVVDLKPYFAEFGPRGAVRQPAWSSELMAGYWTEAAGPRCLRPRSAWPPQRCSCSPPRSRRCWPPAALGGRCLRRRAAQPDGRLSPAFRAASAGTCVFLLVLAAAKLVTSAGLDLLTGRALWAFVALFALDPMANTTGRHPVERWGAGGVTALLTVLLARLATR